MAHTPLIHQTSSTFLLLSLSPSHAHSTPLGVDPRSLGNPKPLQNQSSSLSCSLSSLSSNQLSRSSSIVTSFRSWFRPSLLISINFTRGNACSVCSSDGVRFSISEEWIRFLVYAWCGVWSVVICWLRLELVSWVYGFLVFLIVRCCFGMIIVGFDCWGNRSDVWNFMLSVCVSSIRLSREGFLFLYYMVLVNMESYEFFG